MARNGSSVGATTRDATGTVELTVDGHRVRAAVGTSVAAALLDAGIWTFRTSAGGSPRGPLCGMGICYECRVAVDGVAYRRACLVPVADGMTVTTAGAIPAGAIPAGAIPGVSR